MNYLPKSVIFAAIPGSFPVRKPGRAGSSPFAADSTCLLTAKQLRQRLDPLAHLASCPNRWANWVSAGFTAPYTPDDWIERPAIEANIGSEPVELDEPLRGVVATLAQTHERTEPKFVDIAAVRLDVIADGCRRDDAALETEFAERVLEQLVPSDSSPASVEYHLSHFVGWPRTPIDSTYYPPAEAQTSVAARGARRAICVQGFCGAD